jgi:hypothetical protein
MWKMVVLSEITVEWSILGLGEKGEVWVSNMRSLGMLLYEKVLFMFSPPIILTLFFQAPPQI